MTSNICQTRLRQRLIDQLYVDALLLADEARHYFDDSGRSERDVLPVLSRVSFSCESLKVTTRLMHAIAWLLTQRAVLAGELLERDALDPSRRLEDAPVSDGDTVAALPATAQTLVHASEDLHRRAAKLDTTRSPAPSTFSPVQTMQDRLAMVF